MPYKYRVPTLSGKWGNVWNLTNLLKTLEKVWNSVKMVESLEKVWNLTFQPNLLNKICPCNM